MNGRGWIRAGSVGDRVVASVSERTRRSQGEDEGGRGEARGDTVIASLFRDRGG